MSKVLKGILTVLIVALVGAVLIWAFLQGRKEAGTEAEGERPVRAPNRVLTRNGEVVVALDAATQARNAIELATLKRATHRQGVRASAVVLAVQDLTSLRHSYLTAAAQVERATAALDVSKREYERLKALYQDDQNASAKALQAAEGAWRTDEASLKAARDSLILNESLTQQGWGEVLAKWVVTGSKGLDRILAQDDDLLQVSLPPGSGGRAADTATVQMPGGKTLSARLLSRFPRVDPRIQSPTYLYVSRSRSSLAPGMNLAVLLPTGPLKEGVFIPGSAVVWWQGKAWAYVQTARETFMRREVSTATPVSGGWFVTSGFSPEERMVVTGGQQLLSEEFRSQIQVLGEGGEGGKDGGKD